MSTTDQTSKKETNHKELLYLRKANEIQARTIEDLTKNIESRHKTAEQAYTVLNILASGIKNYMQPAEKKAWAHDQEFPPNFVVDEGDKEGLSLAHKVDTWINESLIHVGSLVENGRQGIASVK